MVQKLGGSVSLRCSARPALANISWRLNGQELLDGDFGAVLGPNSLYIASLSNLTLGRYQCVASTGVGALASVLANVTAASEYPLTQKQPVLFASRSQRGQHLYCCTTVCTDWHVID